MRSPHLLTLKMVHESFLPFYYTTRKGCSSLRKYVDSAKTPLTFTHKPQITYLDEYYLTNYEIEILKKNSAEIASQIPEGSMVIELGSGLVYPLVV